MEEFKYLIPEESSEAMIVNVFKQREIEEKLRKIFYDHQYLEVLLPSFEYVDLYNRLDAGIDEEKLFQFINHEGKSIALRADFTLPLARQYTLSNKDVGRYCYFGKVYRKEKKHKGRTTEFYQVGMELIGEEGTKGEKECLDLISEGLPTLGLKEVKLVIGSAAFYNRLLEIVEDEELDHIIHLRSFSMMKALVKRNHLSESMAKLLMMLPLAVGDISMLDEMIKLIDDALLKDSLIELKSLYMNQENKDISFDLCMVPKMKYYTGLMIRGYTPTCAQPIISGGRYDKLMNKFNKDVPAIGFSYDFHQILHAIEEEEAND